jgi:hypothetical protein
LIYLKKPRDTHHSIEVPPPGSLVVEEKWPVMKERSPTKGCRAMIAIAMRGRFERAMMMMMMMAGIRFIGVVG